MNLSCQWRYLSWFQFYIQSPLMYILDMPINLLKASVEEVDRKQRDADKWEIWINYYYFCQSYYYNIIPINTRIETVDFISGWVFRWRTLGEISVLQSYPPPPAARCSLLTNFSAGHLLKLKRRPPEIVGRTLRGGSVLHSASSRSVTSDSPTKLWIPKSLFASWKYVGLWRKSPTYMGGVRKWNFKYPFLDVRWI